jgi:hypothetical protein
VRVLFCSLVKDLDTKLHDALKKLDSTARELQQQSNEVSLLHHRNARSLKEVDIVHQREQEAQLRAGEMGLKVDLVQIMQRKGEQMQLEQYRAARAVMDKKVNHIHASWSIATAEAEMARLSSELQSKSSEERTDEILRTYQAKLQGETERRRSVERKLVAKEANSHVSDRKRESQEQAMKSTQNILKHLEIENAKIKEELRHARQYVKDAEVR